MLCAALSTTAAFAAPLQLTIQPIQVCNDAGTSCANTALELFEDVGNKIWAQAEIILSFLSFNVFDSTAFLDADFGDLLDPGHGQNADPNVINMWFVNTITDCGGVSGAFGCGLVGGSGVAIADSVFSFNSGIGRLDTIAHELGHNLGLGHDDFGAGGALNLMTGGGTRTIPDEIGDVFPHGAMTDQLTDEQIAEARGSGLLTEVVPEPSSLGLLALGLGLLLQRRRPRT
jgi:hypothetical protein